MTTTLPTMEMSKRKTPQAMMPPTISIWFTTATAFPYPATVINRRPKTTKESR